MFAPKFAKLVIVGLPHGTTKPGGSESDSRILSCDSILTVSSDNADNPESLESMSREDDERGAESTHAFALQSSGCIRRGWFVLEDFSSSFLRVSTD